MRRIIIIGVLVLLILGGYLFFIRKKTPEPEPAPVTTEEEEMISASGSVKAGESVTLAFQTVGKLVWLGVREGDIVIKGQAIAKLDTYELQRDLKNALIAYSKERNDFEEERKVMYKTENSNDAKNDTVKRILEKNQWDLEKSVNDIEIQNYAVRIATLVSPIDGIVTVANPDIAGVNVTPTSASFIISNPTTLIFVAEVDEVDIGLIQEGQKGTIMLDALPDKPIASAVSRLGFANITTEGGGTAYEVFFPLPTVENFQYRIGMNGDVEFEK